jgi:hypothetical protein
MKILLANFSVKAGREVFSNQQSGARFHMKLVMIMELE